MSLRLLCRKEQIDLSITHSVFSIGCVDNQAGTVGGDPHDMVSESEDLFHLRLPLQNLEVGVALGFDRHGWCLCCEGFVNPHAAEFHAVTLGDSADRCRLNLALAF